MKHTLTNPATHFAMLLMALAMAFTFLACGEKKKAEAEQAMTEEEKQAKAMREEDAAWRKEKAVADAARAARAEAKAGAEAEKAAEEAMLKAKANCPEKKIGSSITVEAVFLESGTGELGDDFADFRSSNGEDLRFFEFEVTVEGLKEGDKVTITYQNKQYWTESSEYEGCVQNDFLQSVKLLSKGYTFTDARDCYKSEPSDGNTFTDTRDCKTYKAVKIGEQVWMAENLNYAAEGSKCYNCQKYGRLYDWATAMKACPNGWHLPSEEEWNGLPERAKLLKSKEGWAENGNGTDAFGFAALPGGYGDSGGGFVNAGDLGYWWSASEYDSYRTYCRFMAYDNEDVYLGSYDKSSLLSVRCVKD